jgi:hypothetical protein
MCILRRYKLGKQKLNHMQYYSELIETLTNRSMGFVKVMNPNVNNMDLTVVTKNGNNFFTLGQAGCYLRAITISDAVLVRAGFTQRNGSPRFLTIGQQMTVYSKLYTSGWCLELLADGQDFFYLKPAPNRIEGYERCQVTTIEGFQSEVYAREHREFTLSLLNTVVNKKKLKDKLHVLYGARYVSFNGPCNGMYVDNDPNRPDFVSLMLQPVDANVDPATIELHNFTARGCTVCIRLGNDVIQYTYGMTQNQILQSHAHLQQVLNQHQGVIGEIYNFVEEAMKYALTC